MRRFAAPWFASAIAGSLLLSASPALAHANGTLIAGDSQTGCGGNGCHSGASGASGTFTRLDAGMIGPGETHRFQFQISGGPHASCGFDVTAQSGTLSATPADSNVKTVGNELVHSSPSAACSFTFSWQAPDVGGPQEISLFGAGVSSDGLGSPSGDAPTPAASLTVSVAPPRLSCDRTALSPIAISGTDAPADSLICTNAGGGLFSYSISDDADWLAVTPPGPLDSGQAQTLAVTYTTKSKLPGTYPATITLTPTGGAAPLAVPVSLRIVSGFALKTGDLLVTDFNNARVLRVEPGTGTVTPFSPRSGSGTNLLVHPTGIAFATALPIGSVDKVIYVADFETSQLIAIDPKTGSQSVVRDYYTGGPLSIGGGPWGIAWTSYFGDLGGLWVVASNTAELRLLVVRSGDVANLYPPIYGLDLGTRGVSLGALSTGATLLLAANEGLEQFSPGTGYLPPDYVPPDARRINDVVGIDAGQFGSTLMAECSPSSGAVRWFGFAEGIAVNLATGGFLRCPLSLGLSGIGLSGMDTIFVGDAASDSGGAGQIVRVRALGSSGLYDQSLVASLPDPTGGNPTRPVGLVIAPEDYEAILPPKLECTPLASSSVEEGANAGDQTFTCTNTGTASTPLDYTVSDDAAWLAVVDSTASLGPGASHTHTVAYTTSALAPGAYAATITANGGAAGAPSIPVHLTVTPKPKLSCSPDSLAPRTATQGGASPPGDNFTCTNAGGGTLFYSLTYPSWLTVSGAPPTGLAAGAPFKHQVTYDISSLVARPAPYTGTITLSGPGTPETVAASLQIDPPPTLSCMPHILPLRSTTQGGADPAVTSFTCTNTGGGTLSYGVSEGVPWLDVTPAPPAGLGAGEPFTHTVTYHAHDLAAQAAPYATTITATGGGRTEMVDASLRIDLPPALACTPDSLSPSVGAGLDATDLGFSCSNTGGGSLSYTTSISYGPTASGWLSIDPQTGTGQEHTVHFDTDRLLAGAHSATIAIDAGPAGTDHVSVDLTVQARALQVGDLLLSDLNNGRVLVVDPKTGLVSVFSPRAGAANLLVSPTGIAVEPDLQRLYALDRSANALVGIDLATGQQTLLASLGSGHEPWGLAQDGAGALYVGAQASSQLLGLSQSGGSWLASVVSSDPRLASAFGLEVLGGQRIAVACGAGGLLAYDPAAGLHDFAPAPGAGVQVLDVRAVAGATLFTELQEDCAPAAAALMSLAPPSPERILAAGGLLRCPLALDALDANEIFVADAASLAGGDARVVRAVPNGGGPYAQTLVAVLPDGSQPTLPADIAILASRVPEPEPTAAAIALLGVLALLRRRRCGALGASRPRPASLRMRR